MDDSDSENEGQLLIDESVDASKRKRSSKNPTVKGNVTVSKKKKAAKSLEKNATVKSQRGRPKKCQPAIEEGEKSSVNVRTSNRVRKRVRRHSPSPVRAKKEPPPKKRLRVKLNVKKNNKKTTPKKKKVELETDKNNVDIECVSDGEPVDIQYSSVLVDEDPPKKTKKQVENKGGIKLKLSLGKVLSSQMEGESKNEEPEENSTHPNPQEDEKPVVQPLIITKRSKDSESSGDVYNVSHTAPQDTLPIADEPMPSDEKPSFYSSRSEEHKPLTLKLSVGKPKILKQHSTIGIERNISNAFPNIRRSWSVAGYAGQDDVKPAESTPVINKKDVKQKTVLESPPHLSTTPYFSAGLQSLLDVVSVELKEQNKTSSSSFPFEKSVPQKSVQSQDPLKQPLPLESHFLIRPMSNIPKATENNLSNHQGHLPSLAFPKPKLNFAPKKRNKTKHILKLSPERPSSLLTSVFHSKDQENGEEDPADMTEKEKRRRDKKKVLNSDFVDPDSVVSGSDLKEKVDPAWKKPSNHSENTKPKLGGLSLLMPQMIPMTSDIPVKTVPQIKNTTKCSSKDTSLLTKRPKKGFATAKQRLANKLKIRKTFAY